MKFVIFIIFFLFFIGIGTTASFAEIESDCASCVQIPNEELELYKELFPLTIWTNSPKYDHNSIVQLDGYLRPENNINPVTLIVTNPMGNIVAIEQIQPNQGGSFHVEFNTSSKLWEQDGFYTIKAQSGADTRLFKTEVELVSYEIGEISSCSLSEISVSADNGGLYCIPYSVLGETTGIDGSLSLESKTLSLDVRGQGVDTITLSLPRYLLDAKNPDGSDGEFGIFYNNRPIDFVESDEKSFEFRTITFSYPPGQANIDIVGTTVVPEFGGIALLIMVIGISTTLLISIRRSSYAFRVV